MSKNIAVIFGGKSNENEVSIITGTMTANVLKNSGYNVIAFYIAQDGKAYTGGGLTEIANFKNNGHTNFPRALLASGGIYALNKRGLPKKFIPVDAAINCCHGGIEEGGGIAGLCAEAGIPFASAALFESSVFMDKYLTKLILRALDVKCVDFVRIERVDELDSGGNMPEFPVIVKPVSLGSSIAIEKAEDFESLKNAIETGLIYDEAVIVEKYIENRREINCAAYFYDGEVITSECEEAVTSGDILSYEDKYQGGGKSVLPADIPPDMSQLIKDTVKKVYANLDMRGIVRFDFIVSGDEVYLSEVNTVPGSLSYYLLSKGFKDFGNILTRVIEQAEKDFKEKSGKKILKTGLIENMSLNSCKLGSKQ